MIKFTCPSCSEKLQFRKVVNEFECQSCGSKLVSNWGVVHLQAYLVLYLTLPISYLLAESMLQSFNVMSYSMFGVVTALISGFFCYTYIFLKLKVNLKN